MGKIQNIQTLAVSDTRRAALDIAEAGLQAIDTKNVIHSAVHREAGGIRIFNETVEVAPGGRLVVIGIGKCAVDAAEALEELLGDAISSGVAVDVKVTDDARSLLKVVTPFEGTHPLPSAANIVAAQAVVSALENLTDRDTALFVISGGGSTLLCLPEVDQCEEESKIVQVLMKSGATIQELNTVRKHLSRARGGYLAKYAYPARVISLIFSDVPGDGIGFIASGPTVKDTTTIEEATEILARYNVLATCGIEKCGLIETPKEEKYFERVSNILAVSNVVALTAMSEKGKELGFTPQICDTCLVGEARDIGLAVMKGLHDAPSKTLLLYGGETTVTVRGDGHGGRNLELALSALREVREGELVLSLASDGVDNGAFAGAICDTVSKQAAAEKGADIDAALDRNDAYPFFEMAGNYLLTGHTGSNVSDLMIAIKE